MNIFIRLLIIVFALYSASIEAVEEKGSIEIGVVFGTTDLCLDEGFTFSGIEKSVESITLGLQSSYQWLENYVVELTLGTTLSTNFLGAFDDYDLNQLGALFGYSFDIGHDFRFTPMVGFNHWWLDTEEGALLNPGAEEIRRYKGTDFSYKLVLDVPIADGVTIDLPYENTNHTFGDIKTSYLGLTFEL